MLCCLRNQITSNNWNRRSGSKLLLGDINVCFYSYKLHVIVVIIKFRWLRGCATTSSVENNQLFLPRLFTVRKNIVERFPWWNKLRRSLRVAKSICSSGLTKGKLKLLRKKNSLTVGQVNRSTGVQPVWRANFVTRAVAWKCIQHGFKISSTDA